MGRMRDVFDAVRGRRQAPQPVPRALRSRIQARYDAAQTNNDNVNHWSATDSLSADAAANPAVRKTIRERARYEVANNAYAKGILLTYAFDMIGVGPRLQMLTTDDGLNEFIEREISAWFNAIRLPSKYRTRVYAKVVDGESFAVFGNNPKLPTPVKLDLNLIECDQVTAPMLNIVSQPQQNATAAGRNVDGVVLDQWGNPSEYLILNKHPGDTRWGGNPWAFTPVPAANVLHWFRRDRPGQTRGLCEIMSSLGLFAQLRRYTSAVLSAAESAADWAVILGTDAPPEGAAGLDAPPFDLIELEKNMMTTVPAGWKPYQMKAEQPVTVYDMFVRSIISEIARPLTMPYAIAAADSSNHNYASGRLDHQIYDRSLETEQADIEANDLDRVFAAWHAEAILISGYLPVSARNIGQLPHEWQWSRREHVDPVKGAKADKQNLDNITDTRARIAGRRRQDWRALIKQQGRERRLAIAEGLPVDPIPAQEESANAIVED